MLIFRFVQVGDADCGANIKTALLRPFPERRLGARGSIAEREHSDQKYSRQ